MASGLRPNPKIATADGRMTAEEFIDIRTRFARSLSWRAQTAGLLGVNRKPSFIPMLARNRDPPGTTRFKTIPAGGRAVHLR